jgi:hypothetical protein
VREPRPGLTYSTDHSHECATGASMWVLIDPRHSCQFNHKISWKSWMSFRSGRGVSAWPDLFCDPLFTIKFHLSWYHWSLKTRHVFWPTVPRDLWIDGSSQSVSTLLQMSNHRRGRGRRASCMTILFCGKLSKPFENHRPHHFAMSEWQSWRHCMRHWLRRHRRIRRSPQPCPKG